jgi:hypothetical protein
VRFSLVPLTKNAKGPGSRDSHGFDAMNASLIEAPGGWRSDSSSGPYFGDFSLCLSDKARIPGFNLF